MIKSVRLSDDLEQRLVEAARLTDQPVSELIREAVRQHVDVILGNRLSDCLADVVGKVSVGSGHSRETGRRFVETISTNTRSAAAKRGGRGKRA